MTPQAILSSDHTDRPPPPRAAIEASLIGNNLQPADALARDSLDGEGWELHLPGTAEAVFACSTGRTVACLILKSSDATPSQCGGNSPGGCPSEIEGQHVVLESQLGPAHRPSLAPFSPWELLVMETGFVSNSGPGPNTGVEGEGPCPVGKLQLRPKFNTKGHDCPQNLDLSSTLQLIDISASERGQEGCQAVRLDRTKRVSLSPGDGRHETGVRTIMLVACGVWSVDGWEEEHELPMMSSGGKDAESLNRSRHARSSSVDIFTLCHDGDGDISLMRRLSTVEPVEALCVLAVEHLGIVVAAGR